MRRYLRRNASLVVGLVLLGVLVVFMVVGAFVVDTVERTGRCPCRRCNRHPGTIRSAPTGRDAICWR